MLDSCLRGQSRRAWRLLRHANQPPGAGHRLASRIEQILFHDEPPWLRSGIRSDPRGIGLHEAL